MLWAARGRRVRARLRRSLLAIPACYLLVAVVLGDRVPALDRHAAAALGLDKDIDTARDIFTSTATGMIDVQLARLDVAVARAFGGSSDDLALALVADRTGIGLRRH